MNTSNKRGEATTMIVGGVVFILIDLAVRATGYTVSIQYCNVLPVPCWTVGLIAIVVGLVQLAQS